MCARVSELGPPPDSAEQVGPAVHCASTAEAAQGEEEEEEEYGSMG